MARLRGEFHPITGRPFVGGTITIPRLRTLLDTEFLVDTGADVSVLNPADAIALGIASPRSAQTVQVGGVTGRAEYHREWANLTFQVGQQVFIYRLRLLVAPMATDLLELPSLLGRDVLNRWDMSYRPTRNHLSFGMVSADDVDRVR